MSRLMDGFACILYLTGEQLSIIAHQEEILLVIYLVNKSNRLLACHCIGSSSIPFGLAGHPRLHTSLRILTCLLSHHTISSGKKSRQQGINFLQLSNEHNTTGYGPISPWNIEWVEDFLHSAQDDRALESPYTYLYPAMEKTPPKRKAMNLLYLLTRIQTTARATQYIISGSDSGSPRSAGP